MDYAVATKAIPWQTMSSGSVYGTPVWYTGNNTYPNPPYVNMPIKHDTPVWYPYLEDNLRRDLNNAPLDKSDLMALIDVAMPIMDSMGRFNLLRAFPWAK